MPTVVTWFSAVGWSLHSFMWHIHPLPVVILTSLVCSLIDTRKSRWNLNSFRKGNPKTQIFLPGEKRHSHNVFSTWSLVMLKFCLSVFKLWPRKQKATFFFSSPHFTVPTKLLKAPHYSPGWVQSFVRTESCKTSLARWQVWWALLKQNGFSIQIVRQITEILFGLITCCQRKFSSTFVPSLLRVGRNTWGCSIDLSLKQRNTNPFQSEL